MSNYHPLPQRKIDEIRSFLLVRDGYYCTHCGKSVKELILISEARGAITKKLRKRPVLIIHHINGDPRQQDGPNGEYCGNTQLVCHSCNKIASQEPTLQPIDANISREKSDSEKGEAAFHKNLEAHLRVHEQICFENIKRSSKHLSDDTVKETACLRYLDSELFNTAHPDARYQEFSFDCGNKTCTGTHYCLVGTTPETLISNEKKRLQHKYNQEYMGGDKKKFDQYSGNWNKPFILFEEFYTLNRLLGNHQFI